MKYNFTNELTPYVKYGDWFAWSCLVLGLAGAAIPALTGRGYAERPPAPVT
jgi:apolipoprotein N-acyltransferase